MMLERAWVDALKIHDVAELATIAHSLRSVRGLGSPPPKRASSSRPRGHGSTSRTRWYQERIIDLVGYTNAGSIGATQTAIDELKGAFALGAERIFRFRRSAFAEDDQVAFRVASELNAPGEGYQKTVRWDVSIEAPDPRIYGAALKSGTYDPTAFAMASGADVPLMFPLMFGAAGEMPEHLHVTNAGNFETPPVFTITGPATNPIIDNETTDEHIYTKNLALLAGETLVIDVAKKTARLGGPVGTLRLDVIDPAPTTWFELVKGENMLRLRGADFVAAQTSLVASFRDARI